MCAYDGFNADPKLAEVTKAAATGYFGCSTAKECLPAKLRHGDAVLVYRVDGDWTCGYLTERGGAGPGWVRSQNIRAVAADPNPPLAAWTGTWKGGEDRVTIRLSKTPGALELEGAAAWHGVGSVVHTGDIEGEATPRGNHLHYADSDSAEACSIDLTLSGKFIIASDNNHCGGMNVRFEGIWKRSGN